MAETPETNKPDFRNGFPIRDLRDGSTISGQSDGEDLVLAAAMMSSLPSAPTAPTMAARSQKDDPQNGWIKLLIYAGTLSGTAYLLLRIAMLLERLRIR